MSVARLTAFTLSAITLLAALLGGCDGGPKPIRYGRDECAECKMILVDPHYGAEFITARGKAFVFDDLNCLTEHLQRAGAAAAPPARSFVADFNHAHQLLAVDQAWFLHHPGLRSPMASSLAAFSSEAELDTVRRQLGGGGRVLRWADVKALPP